MKRGVTDRRIGSTSKARKVRVRDDRTTDEKLRNNRIEKRVRDERKKLSAL
jgi:hypothetical protein